MLRRRVEQRWMDVHALHQDDLCATVCLVQAQKETYPSHTPIGVIGRQRLTALGWRCTRLRVRAGARQTTFASRDTRSDCFCPKKGIALEQENKISRHRVGSAQSTLAKLTPRSFARHSAPRYLTCGGVSSAPSAKATNQHACRTVLPVATAVVEACTTVPVSSRNPTWFAICLVMSVTSVH